MSEDSSSEQSHNSYTFYAKTFSDAVEELKKTLGHIDLSHMSVFFTDEAYLSDKFIFDARYIKEKIKISPLVKIFITQNSQEDIIKGITANNTHAIEKYLSAVFFGDRKKLLCTMPELFLASVNPFFTASIPHVSINSENDLPKVESVAFYNSEVGLHTLETEDFPTFEKTITSYGKSSKFLDISYSKGQLLVSVDKNCKWREKLCNLSEKYKAYGFDIYNSRYFAKKCFLTYSSYLDAIENISTSDISFNWE